MSSNEYTTPAEKPKPKGNKCFKKQSCDVSRMEDHCKETGTKTVQEMKSKLFDQLFFGYATVTTAMKNIQLNQLLRTVHLPISTRSVGFMIQNMAVKFQQLSVLQILENVNLMHALYRITLYEIEYKLEEAMTLQHSRNLARTTYVDAFVPGDIRRALSGMGAGFAPLVNYVSAIGFVKTTYAAYLPRHPIIRNCCDPLHIRIHDLRRLVRLLANEHQDGVRARRYFAEHNPIPGARWHVTAPRRNARGVECCVGTNLQFK